MVVVFHGYRARWKRRQIDRVEFEWLFEDDVCAIWQLEMQLEIRIKSDYRKFGDNWIIVEDKSVEQWWGKKSNELTSEDLTKLVCEELFCKVLRDKLEFHDYAERNWTYSKEARQSVE